MVMETIPKKVTEWEIAFVLVILSNLYLNKSP